MPNSNFRKQMLMQNDLWGARVLDPLVYQHKAHASGYLGPKQRAFCAVFVNG